MDAVKAPEAAEFNAVPLTPPPLPQVPAPLKHCILYDCADTAAVKVVVQLFEVIVPAFTPVGAVKGGGAGVPPPPPPPPLGVGTGSGTGDGTKIGAGLGEGLGVGLGDGEGDGIGIGLPPGVITVELDVLT